MGGYFASVRDSVPLRARAVEVLWTDVTKVIYGDGSKPWYLVNPKIAGKWMFIPPKMVCIGIDP